jgi:flagellar biosynthetic protein FliQ
LSSFAGKAEQAKSEGSGEHCIMRATFINEMDWMPQAVRDGVIVVLVISGPMVLAAAAIGLLVGILQAATQVQEQTIGSALKIIGVFALIIIGGFWMFRYLNQYTSSTLSTAFTFIPRQTQKVVPPNFYNDKGQINYPTGPGKIPLLVPEKIDFGSGNLPIGAMLLGSHQEVSEPKVENPEVTAPDISKLQNEEPIPEEKLPEGYQELMGYGND